MAATHSIYVIELDPVVLESRKFKKANRNYVQGMPCVYVGMTGLTPERRFANHKQGAKACSFVRLFGMQLLPDLYDNLNPLCYDDALAAERKLADRLRGMGFGVWQA